MFSGKSGEKYCFQVWSFGTRFRDVGAVFFVTRRLYKNATYHRASHEVIHIGETASMALPLGTGTELQAFEKLGANCVCVFRAENEAWRRRVVDDLLAGHRPLFAS